MQFPLVISHDLRSFIVLRTVFNISKASADTTDSLTYCSWKIGMDFTQSLRFNWQNRLDSEDTRQCKAQEVTNFPYIYDFQFSPDDRYILFQDFSEIGLPGDGCRAAFEMALGSQSISVGLLEYITEGTSTSHRKLFCIHPSLPLVAFARNFSVWLWNFKSTFSETPNPRGSIPRHLLTNGFRNPTLSRGR